MAIRLSQAMGAGIRFDADRNENGIASTAPVSYTHLEGYDPAFSTCVNIASAPTGLLIPPTSAFIVYSTVAGGVSVSALFMAGYIPGILMGLSTMAIAYCYAKKHNYPVCPKVSASEAVRCV